MLMNSFSRVKCSLISLAQQNGVSFFSLLVCFSQLLNRVDEYLYRFNSNQSNGVGRGLLPNLASGGAPNGPNGSTGGAHNQGQGNHPLPPHLVSCGTTIIIHVCDENKKLNKDFKCDKQLLITNMKYFEKYLSD